MSEKKELYASYQGRLKGNITPFKFNEFRAMDKHFYILDCMLGKETNVFTYTASMLVHAKTINRRLSKINEATMCDHTIAIIGAHNDALYREKRLRRNL